jgi:hypothetical protein
MTLKLGTTDAAIRLGSATPAAVYLGSEQVWTAATVPGAPTDVSASMGAQYTINYSPPASNGGSEITSYKFYSDGVEITPDGHTVGAEAVFSVDYSGTQIQVSAVNAIGEGPKSAAITG